MNPSSAGNLAGYSKFIVDNLLPGGGLLTLGAEALTPALLYPRDAGACERLMASGRQALTLSEQLRLAAGHPCENALGMWVAGIEPIMFHVYVLVPLAILAMIVFLLSQNK